MTDVRILGGVMTSTDSRRAARSRGTSVPRRPSRGSAWQTTSTTTSSSSGPEPGAAPSGTGSPPSGAKVLWLERGPFLPRERDNWETAGGVRPREVPRAQRTGTTGTASEFQPEVNYYVGGNTKFYGAALFRLRPEDFGELRHHGGISPAWPISYDDLEPYYTQAEHLYLVHGQHGEDPTEGPASAQYAYPAGVPRAAHPAAERRPGEARAAPVPPADRGQPPGGGARPARPGRARASAATGSTASRAW